MFSTLLSPLYSFWPFSAPGSGNAKAMSVTYFKRYRMEIDLRGQAIFPPRLPAGYRLVPWSAELVDEHAEVKFRSFRGEIDSGVFPCLSEPTGCLQLMEDIAAGTGFVPEATWLIRALDSRGEAEPCGTIQGVRVNPNYGAIQNVGVVPYHRQRGIGRALVTAALLGFQQIGVPRAYLEVTAQNRGAVRLYQRLGFRKTKTLYKAVELALT